MTARLTRKGSGAARLRELLGSGQMIVAPGAFDALAARCVEEAGFDAVYMTGFGTAAALLGRPDVGLVTLTEMADNAARIAACVDIPVIADADTGYGGLLNVRHTVRGYEDAGACGIQLEDQEFPKKCGHMLGRRVIAAEDMAAKVRVAADSRSHRDFLIIARTDARTTLGLDEALRRAERYLRAGADVLFVESPESVEEMRRIGETFRGVPLLANMVQGGRTPLLDRGTLQELGYRIAIHPGLAFLATGAAIEAALSDLKAERPVSVPLYDFKAFSALMGFDWVSEFERRYREDGS